MPTYDYACAACGHRFERFESIHEKGSKPCPKCGKKRARRKMGIGAGLIFKGSGFYTTDYKRSSSGEAAKEGESKKSEPDAKKSEPKEKKKEEKEQKK